MAQGMGMFPADLTKKRKYLILAENEVIRFVLQGGVEVLLAQKS